MSIDQDDRPIQLDEGFFDDPEALYRELRVDRPVARATAPNARDVLAGHPLRRRPCGAERPAPGQGREADPGPDGRQRRRRAAAPRTRRLARAAHAQRGPARPHAAAQARRQGVHDAARSHGCGRGSRRSPDELADAMAAAGPSVDLLDEFAFPLPDDRDLRDPRRPAGPARGVPALVEHAARPARNDEERAAAAGAMAQFLAALVADKAENPRRRHAVRDRPRLRGRRHAQPRRDDRRWRSCCSSPGTRRRST